MKIRELTNQDPDFYTVMGPYLANRAVVKFVGDNIWDDPDKIWLVATTATGQVAGFAAFIVRGRRAVAESLYLLDPEDRATAEALIAHTVTRFGEHAHLHAVVRNERAAVYTAHGFNVVKPPSANFTTLVRPATSDEKNARA